MANGLELVADILKRLNDEIKLDNDKWERANGRIDVLPTSDAATTRDRDKTTGGSK